MKRINLLITVLVLGVLLAACGGNDDNNNNNTDNNDGVNNNQTEQNNADNNVNDNDNENENNNENDDVAANNENNEDNDSNDEFHKTGTEERMKDLPFTVINLKVTYDDDAYQLDIAYRNEFVNVHLQDDFEDEYLRGRDAFDIVFPSLEELDLSADADEDEAISQILAAFDLDEDYTAFELEMEYDDGTLEVEE